MRILVFLSGGADSTALCYYLLALHPIQHDIHIHHMCFDSVGVGPQGDEGGRYSVEMAQCRHITDWLRQHCRPFKYTESNIRMPKIPGRQYNDHIWAAFHGASMINTSDCQVFATGRILTDNNAGGWPSVQPALKLFKQIVASPKESHRGEGACDPLPAYWVCPVITWTKGEQFMRVPRELMDLSVSCRRPVFGPGRKIVACEECRTCQRRAQALEAIGKFDTVELVNDYLCRISPPGSPGRKSGPRYYDEYQPWYCDMTMLERLEAQGVIR